MFTIVKKNTQKMQHSQIVSDFIPKSVRKLEWYLTKNVQIKITMQNLNFTHKLLRIIVEIMIWFATGPYQNKLGDQLSKTQRCWVLRYRNTLACDDFEVWPFYTHEYKQSERIDFVMVVALFNVHYHPFTFGIFIDCSFGQYLYHTHLTFGKKQTFFNTEYYSILPYSCS